MDLISIGQRIKAVREERNLTQEELAALTNVSPSHISIIECGRKVLRLDTFVAIANALKVSPDALLIDVAEYSVTGATSELSKMISGLPLGERKRIINVVRAMIED